MLMIPARLGRSESFWAVAKVRSPHTGPGISYIIECTGYVEQDKGSRIACYSSAS